MERKERELDSRLQTIARRLETIPDRDLGFSAWIGVAGHFAQMS